MIKQTVSSVVGLEIVEETSSQIVLQLLLEPSGFPPKKLHRFSFVGLPHDVEISTTFSTVEASSTIKLRTSNSLPVLIMKASS